MKAEVSRYLDILIGRLRATQILPAFVLLTLLITQFSPALAQTREIAVQKLTLPEFRDISVWKGRAGLIRFSNDSRLLAVSGKIADIVIYDIATGEIKSKIDARGYSQAFSFSPDNEFAVTQSAFDLSMQVFDVASGAPVREIRGLGKTAMASKRLGGAGLINELNGVLPVIVLEMGDVPVTKDWKNILVNKNDREFSIIDFDTGTTKFDLKHENFNTGWETTKIALTLLSAAYGSSAGALLLGSKSNAQFSRDGKFLFVSNGNSKPTLWNVTDGSLVSKYNAGEKVFYSKFSLDATMVATSDFDGITKIWSTATGENLSTVGSKAERGVIAGWNKDGTRFFVNPRGKGDLRAYDPKTGKLAYSFEKSMAGGTLFSDDQKLLITVPQKNKSVLFQIWETDTGRLVATVPRAKKQDAVISIKWNPNGQLIAATEGLKKEIKLFSLNGELLQTLKNSTVPMQFSADGGYLATGGIVTGTKNETGILWEVRRPEPDERLARAPVASHLDFEDWSGENVRERIARKR